MPQPRQVYSGGSDMAEQVDIPKIGKVPKKYLIASGILVAGYVGYRWWVASAATGEPDPFTPSVDEGGPDASGVVGAPMGGNIQYAGTSTDATDPNRINTNDQWFNTAVERLSSTGGWEGGAVQAALGEFLARKPLDETEQSIVNAALGAAGHPPENRPWTVIPQVGPTTLEAPRVTGTGTSNSVKLTWNAVTGATAYAIYRSGQAEAVGSSIDTTHTVVGLNPGVSYTFTVKAVSTLGKEGPASAPVTVKTGTTGLAKVATPSVSSIARTTAKVSWRAVSGATGYRVVVGSSKGGQAVGAVGTSVVLRDLRPNTRYTVRVEAKFNTAWGPSSDTKAFMTKR